MESVTVAEAVRFLERQGMVVLGCALVAALITALVVGVLLPATYSSSATLVVVPPSVSSDLQPQVLSVHGYQTLLESDAVVYEAHRRLVERGLLEQAEPFELGKDLYTRIFVSRREESTSLAPMLEAVARAPTAELAAEAANTWVAVFLERVKDVVQRATLVGVNFVEQQYPETQTRLAEAEAEWVTTANEFDQQHLDMANGWDRRIAEHRKASADRLAEHRAESRALITGYLDEHPASTVNGAVPMGVEVRHLLAVAAALRAQMAQTPVLIQLEKAMSEEAVWESVVSRRAINPSETLVTEEPNPVYNDLALRTAQAEGELAAAAGDDPVVAQISRGLEKLQQERSAGLLKLNTQLELERSMLERSQRRELKAIERQREVKMGQLDRALDQVGQLERALSRDYSEAVLAKAQDDVATLFLASPAVAVRLPEKRNVVLATLIGAVVGGFLGLGAGVVREARSRRDG